MNYSIIGSGKIGAALAKHFARNGIPVAIANTRGPQSIAPLVKELGSAIHPQTLAEAIQADVIFLAVPFASHASVARAAPDWSEKVVVDAMNAFGVPPETFEDSASSEVVARAFPGAKLVKAFNHLPAAILASDPTDRGGRRVVYVSSNDRQAGATVAALAEKFGFAPIALGDLPATRALLDVRGESLGPLLLQNLIELDQEKS